MGLDSLSRGADSVKSKARGLIPWLPHFDCPNCGRVCEADVTFDQRMVEYTHSWYCEPCDQHFYREEPWDPDPPEPPREKSSRLRNLFSR